jgi:hypothetical protein
VKVEGDRGLDIGVVSEIYSEIMDISFTKKILCLATQEEILYSLSKEKDEVAAVELCRALVARRGLSICIVDAEFQCDRKKLTFFFTSDRYSHSSPSLFFSLDSSIDILLFNRHTDFRELVRDLFATFKTRIWMQKIKGPTGHSPPQLIRRPLPPTHPNPPFSPLTAMDPNDVAYRQATQPPLYQVPRSLQSQTFMGSGADYQPQQQPTQVLYQPPPQIDYQQQQPTQVLYQSQPHTDYQQPAQVVYQQQSHTEYQPQQQPTQVLYQSQSNPQQQPPQVVYQQQQPQSVVERNREYVLGPTGYSLQQGLISPGLTPTQTDPQGKSFLKPLVRKFRQIFHPSGQEEQVVEEYLQTGFGIPQHQTYGIQYVPQMPPQPAPYPTPYYPSNEMYLTTQLQSHPPPLSLTQPDQYAAMSAANSTQIPQQDTLSMFNLSHFSTHETSHSLPAPVASNYHPAPAIEENLWLATVSQQQQQQAETSNVHSITPQIPLPPSIEPSPSLSLSFSHQSSPETSEENHTPELLSLSNSLNDLSVSAEPYVYGGGGGDATTTMVLHQIN